MLLGKQAQGHLPARPHQQARSGGPALLGQAHLAVATETDGLDLSAELRDLEEKVETLRQEIYSKLTRWQRVQLSRHPQRP